MTLTATTKTKKKALNQSKSTQLRKKKSIDDKKTLKTNSISTETAKRKKDEDESAGKVKKAKVTIIEPVKEKEAQNSKTQTKAKAVEPPKEKKPAKPKILAPLSESDSESEIEEAQPKKSQPKSSATVNLLTKQPPKLISANASTKSTKPTASNTRPTNTKRKAKSLSPTPSESDESAESGGEEDGNGEGAAKEDSEEDEEDVHLHGFSTDEDDSSDEEEGEDKPGLSAFEISKLPTVAKDDESIKRKLEKAKRQPTEDRGVVYIGRLPHGFYEDQLKGYFSQFGDITRLRISRNKKTGKCKHYGFIEFDSSSVAKIVAETMDNYLLCGHILKCQLIPKDKVHPELWIGANRKWRTVPRDRVIRVQHNKPRTIEQKERATQRLIKRQNVRKRKLEALGIEYEFNAIGYKKPKAAGKA